MSDASDDDIDDVPDSQLVNMPASNLGAGNAGRIQNRIDRLFEQSLSEDNISAYALPLFMNFKLRRQRELEARAEALEEEEFEERHKTPLGEREEIRQFMEAMDRHIQAQQSALDSIKANQEKLARLHEELDARTLVVNGRKVYRDGDHFVDENGERLNEKDEAEAQRLLKLHPDAATFERLQQLRDAEDLAATKAQTVEDNIKADNTAKTGANTPDQRTGAETKAGEHAGQAGAAARDVGESTTALSNAMSKEISALPKVNAGKGSAPSAIATLVPPPGKDLSPEIGYPNHELSNFPDTGAVALRSQKFEQALPPGIGTLSSANILHEDHLNPTVLGAETGEPYQKFDAAAPGAKIKSSEKKLDSPDGLTAPIAGALPLKNNVPLDVDKGNPKQIHGDTVSEQAVASNNAATWTEARALMNQKVSLTSYASTLSPAPGKGDLTSSFDAALINIEQPQTASADADAKVDKSPLSTEFAAVVTPSESTPDQTSDDKVTPATPAAQRQTVAV